MVLERLDKADIRVNGKKYRFGRKEVEYLGYIINEEGLHQVIKKIKVIVDAPSPENSTQISRNDKLLW